MAVTLKLAAEQPFKTYAGQVLKNAKALAADRAAEILGGLKQMVTGRQRAELGDDLQQRGRGRLARSGRCGR